MAVKLSYLVGQLPHVFPAGLSPGAPDPDITGITADSRTVSPGSLFVALRGETVDGHRFIPDALARGAAAVIIEDSSQGSHAHTPTRPHANVPTLWVPNTPAALAWLAAAWHGFPARHLVMVGVTGTDGKTTTASLIHSMLQAAGLRAGLVSTVNAVIGDEALDTGFHVTTPDALAVQALLARMVAAGLTHCVLEVTSHGLAQHRVTGCEFDVAVATNITHEHLDYHKTFAAYRAAKGRLFAGLAEAASKPGGPPKTTVLNADDASHDYLAGLLAPAVQRVDYGLRPVSGIWASDIEHTPNGLAFVARGPEFAQPVQSALTGLYNVSNCLAALGATVIGLGVAPETAARGLAALPGVPGRMERIDLGQPFTAMVDFAHTPNALRRALETARLMLRPAAAARDSAPVHQPTPPGSASSAISAVKKGGRVIAVFGSAGLRDVEKRRLMAEVSAELADLSILTAEDPRTESLDDILEMMAGAARQRGGVEGQTFFRVPDRGDALRLAVRLAQPGDLVLACGKGHEQSMAFGAVEYPWDDRTALRAALAERLGLPGYPMPHLPTSRTS